MAQLDEHARVLALWLQLPESRRRDATDVVAFAYRLLQERPESSEEQRQATFEAIVGWITPLLQRQ